MLLKKFGNKKYLIVLVSVGGMSITQQDLDRSFILQNFLYRFQREEFEKNKQEGLLDQNHLTYAEPKPKMKEEVLHKLIEKEMLYLESIEQGCAATQVMNEYIQKLYGKYKVEINK